LTKSPYPRTDFSLALLFFCSGIQFEQCVVNFDQSECPFSVDTGKRQIVLANEMSNWLWAAVSSDLGFPGAPMTTSGELTTDLY
jgi:hypothetical protein